MQERLERRLAELVTEQEAGHKVQADLRAQQAELEQTLLRISGAIQVLEELLDEDDAPAEPEPAPAVSTPAAVVTPGPVPAPPASASASADKAATPARPDGDRPFATPAGGT